jgi:hypothetical protein
MTLAAILGVSLLLALPPSGKALAAPVLAIPQAVGAQQQPPAPSGAASEDGSSSSQSASQEKSGAEAHSEQVPPPEKPGQQASKPVSGTKGSARKSPARKATAPRTTKRHHKHPKKPGAEPPKVVVPNGGATDPSVQLAPSLTKQQAADQRQDTNELLASTESNLKAIAGQELQPSQRDMVKQIEQYMAQAKGATKAGDLERAHNLALKAQLLSKELVKH